MFVFSTDSFSSDHTSRFITPILKFLAPHLSTAGLQFWHHVIRKAGHVTEYCVLGILIYRALRVDIRRIATARILTLIGVAGAALMDEYHQSFVLSRTASIVDVGYDCAGGVLGLLMIWIWIRARTVEE